jgi:Fe-Mn family superoxide dismutase
MPYQPKNFDHLLGTPGFSDKLLKDHFTLYQGYVKNTNLLIEKLAALRKAGQEGTPEFAELNRRFGWEFNGMRLHELYFGNMAKTPTQPPAAVAKLLTEQFGSLDAFVQAFKATGKSRGIGWVILYQDLQEKAVHPVWVNEHDVGHLAGGNPLLVMDVFEHAFMTDYGLNRAAYLDAFFNAVDWAAVGQRLKR